jgi:hypothetical protein
MPRPSKRQDTATFEMTVPKSVFDALVHLASVGPMGWTENLVATALVSREIERMQRDGEYGLSMPTVPPAKD